MFTANNKTALTAVLILIATLLLGTIANIKVFAQNTSYADDILTSYAKIQKQGNELQKAIGENSIIPQLFIKTNSMILNGATEVEAREEASKQLVEDMAIQEYADNNGISVSKDELKIFIDDIIQVAHEDNNFSAIKSSCEKQGLTFEETLYNNRAHYYIDCLKSKIYRNLIKKTFGNRTKINELEIKKINRKWDDLKEKSIKAYRKEPECDKIESMAKKETLSYRQLYNKGEKGHIDDIEYVSE